MRNRGLGSWPARRARMTPHRPAVVVGAHTWTYADLAEESTRLAHGLRSLGVGPGDRVAYVGFNHPSALQALFAAGMLGAIHVPLNARLSPPELAFGVRDAGARVLLHGSGTEGHIGELAADLPDVTFVGVHGPAAGGTSLDALLADAPVDPIDEPVGHDDPALIMYTSGTTGHPKGAVLSHGNITWNCLNVLVELDLTGDEVTLLTAPLFHAAALNMTALPTVLKGGRVVVVESFDPGEAFDLIEQHRVTWMFGVPAMYQAMAQHPRWTDADLSSVRHLECGGAPVPESLIRTYDERGLVFLQGYGMTEASPGVLFLGEDMRHKVGSAGTPSFFTDVRLVGPDGEPAAVGEVGEIEVSGPNVMAEYWQRPDATADALGPDGWFRSGDAATVDEDGCFTICDRMKDMYISGGENVYPAEVEAALLEHPDIDDVGVIGVPDERWGEVGAAIVVARDGTQPALDDVAAFLDGRLARFKIPKHLHLVDELPRSGPGKIAKPALRARFAPAPAPHGSPAPHRQGQPTS